MMVSMALILAPGTKAQDTTPVFTSLYSFAGGTDGADPETALLASADGVLYGTTYMGGLLRGGTAFSLTPPASPGGSWTETILQTFNGPNGAYPASSLVKGKGGALYGVTLTGGENHGAGTVYALTPPAVAGNPWTQTVLYSFPFALFGPLGFNPQGTPLIGEGGVIYGVNTAGGVLAGGTAFSLTPPSSPGAPWTEATLHTFGLGSGDGSGPTGGLIADRSGVLYGVTGGGGAGYGTVYSLKPPATPGGSWSETVLYNFPGGTGGARNPFGTLTAGPGPVYYGTAILSGTNQTGIVFSITPPSVAGGSWTEQVIHTFKGGKDGGVPAGAGGLLRNPKTGALYGVAAAGSQGYGIVFELKPPASPGGAWTERVLHTFDNTDGRYPSANPVAGPGGVLYGATVGGGTQTCMCGTVYSLAP